MTAAAYNATATSSVTVIAGPCSVTANAYNATVTIGVTAGLGLVTVTGSPPAFTVAALAGPATAVATAGAAPIYGVVARGVTATVTATAYGAFTKPPFTARCGTPYVTWSVGQVTRRGPSAELALV